MGGLLSYARLKGHAFIHRELYLPKEWAGDPQRSREAGVPEGVEFRTKPEIARRMLQRAFDAGVDAERVLADEVYGRGYKQRELNCPVEGWERWALCRRSIPDPGDLAYYLVFVPTGTSLEEVVGAAGGRWTIEEAIEQAKGEVGLDEYEVRSWRGWYRHITLSMLAHAYLAVTRAQAEPKVAKGGALGSQGTGSLAEFKRRRGLAG